MKNVLFVDDDRAVLDGLRSRLHRLHNKWNMKFVESGAWRLSTCKHTRVTSS